LFADLVRQMKAFEQRKYLNAVLVHLVKEFFYSEMVAKQDTPIASSPTISGAARLLHNIINNNDVLKDYLVASLTRSSIPSLDESLGVRRSVIAALAEDEGQYQRGMTATLILMTYRQIADII
jgi:telomere length regulation protein